jgi:hypothetical protein
MTAEAYLTTKLKELARPRGLSKPTREELADVIFGFITTKKFRKYSATPELLNEIKEAVRLNIENQEPISFVYPHGVYKLWRLEEAPEADWAELFAFMHYTSWLKAICEIYEPGVWFDFYADDLLVPRINNVPLDDVKVYQSSYQKVLDFLDSYRPSNFKMTITTVGDQFESEDAFYKKLEVDTERLAQELPGGLPELDAKRIATIELNSHATDAQKQDPLWREKIALVHDAYLKYTKSETNYHFNPHKIRVFTSQLTSKAYIAVGTTKDSIAKFWVGVGALNPTDDSYRQIILTPSQLVGADYTWEDIHLDGLVGKNFSKIRILK